MHSKTIVFLAFLLVGAPAFGQTAAECITEFQGMKERFDLARGTESPLLNCVLVGNTYKYLTEGPLPAGCEDQGSWDHWHLEASAVIGSESYCTMMLRGQEGVAACEAPELRIDLPANEAQAWRRFLREECGAE